MEKVLQGSIAHCVEPYMKNSDPGKVLPAWGHGGVRGMLSAAAGTRVGCSWVVLRLFGFFLANTVSVHSVCTVPRLASVGLSWET